MGSWGLNTVWAGTYISFAIATQNIMTKDSSDSGVDKTLQTDRHFKIGGYVMKYSSSKNFSE